MRRAARVDRNQAGTDTLVCTYCHQDIEESGTNHGSPDFPICEECMLNTVSMGLDDELLWEE